MRGVLKKAAVHLALVALVMRALLPAGWMPSTGEHHASPIMLCPGMDHMAMPMPGEPAQKPDHAKSTYCACAAVGHVSLASPHCAVGLPAGAPQDIAFAATPIRFAVATAYRANAARAPPSLA